MLTCAAVVPGMGFAGRANIHDCLAPEVKTGAHAATLAVLKPFIGRFSYVTTESRSLASGGGS